MAWLLALLSVLTAGQSMFMFNVLWSLKGSKKAEKNPWRATTLEWTVPSPPPHDNFGGEHKTIYRPAYEYSVPGGTEDFVM